MNKLPNHTALKEWSNVIDALGRGEQVILIRKGGIADPKFGVEAERFYLYPTFFHQQQSEPEAVTITHWCEVVRNWRVYDLESLYRLEPLVVMSRETLETRYRFRPDQALHVIGVRAFALLHPRTIRVQPEYIGCKSWVSVDDEIDVDGSLPALNESELQDRLSVVSSQLSLTTDNR
ncbi:MAG TPA: DUF1802 family protein [Thermoanaerobaculia bacterium]